MIDIILFIAMGAMLFYVKDLESRLFEQEKLLLLIMKMKKTGE